MTDHTEEYDEVRRAKRHLDEAQAEYDAAASEYNWWHFNFRLMTRDTYRKDHIHFSFSIGPNGGLNKDDSRVLPMEKLLGVDWHARVHALVLEREVLLHKAGEKLAAASKTYADVTKKVFA